MEEFLIVAYDGTDSEAMERRLRNRQAHLDGVKVLREKGNFINGGALLNDAGEMIGSSLFAKFSSRAELDEWLKTDPYVTGGVWQHIEVKRVRLV
ncbi:MAG: hypothetical protein KDD60_03025 [Bdellovibrionales bacterium]|nr:hypothetical protein [Bdellovibrionales bacterium]